MPRSREELVEALREVAHLERGRGDSARLASVANVQRNRSAAVAEAADLLDSLEEREEFRLVGTERRTGHHWEGQPRRERPKPWDLSQLRGRNDNVRIQLRTVTETPWTDVEEGTDGR